MNKINNYLFLFVITFSSIFCEPNDATVTRIPILKCCPHGQELKVTVENGINKVSNDCEKSTTDWKPNIYSPSLRKQFNKPLDGWNVLEGRRPECREDSILTSIVSRPSLPFIYLEDGFAIVDGNVEEPIAPSDYCADPNAILVCVKKTPEGNHAAATMKPKIRRCCGKSAVFHEEKESCSFINESEDTAPLLGESSGMVDIISGFPACPRGDKYTILADVKDAVLQPDGSMKVDGVILPSGQFCVEKIKELNQAVKVFACSEHAPQRPHVQATDIRFTLYPMGFIISAVFLAATLAAGWLLPASHHVLHWRCQTHHVACLMLGDLLMAIIQLAGDSLRGASCKTLAIMAHFFFLAAFFWLNTMCFNIWWTFRDLRPASLEKGQETLRLRVYACYAWGGPLLVAGLAALLDHLSPQTQYTYLRPRFGERQCWFYGDMEILAYFFGPIGALLAVNLLFFAATARELTCGLWKGEFVKSTTESRAALGWVCMKLVIVMGITWVADVVSWAVGGPQYIWYFTDLINAFQGVLIFAVVGCQPQVRAALKRLCNRNPRTNASRQGNGLSTTSHGMPSMGDSVTQNPSTKTAPLETIC
ncbi:PREDICTED: probable G-protein coupled receptor Mth-like 1 isoform X1 [Polistes dominula]|uniref:Probable G-protein coupled receptor Mth-like 1 isoform X1 n=1 Tax=Polistes dominula TaxID=743375 RepID=A0ABM1I0Q7_POLDO|nr:PREDICTED: probable G-protein coupled receptor Mth-like 1 isoform X1 [Polistes dominula]